jgi:hypothetical protein
VAGEAVPPPGRGVGVTGEFVGDLKVGGLVGFGTAQDETSAEGESLRGEARVGNLGEALAFVRAKGKASRFAGHEGASLQREKPGWDNSQEHSSS